eukprot:2817577-Rhodomonas_salina.3
MEAAAFPARVARSLRVLVFGFAVSSQLTAHSSQLTAHSAARDIEPSTLCATIVPSTPALASWPNPTP